MAHDDAALLTERLRQADHARTEGADAWFRAAWESHRQFAGRFTVDGEAHSDGATTMNLQYAATRTLHAGILPKRLRLKCKAVIPSEEPNAYRASILGNWSFHRNRMLRVMDRVELDGQTKGVGISYTTWGSRLTPALLSRGALLEAQHTKGKRGTTDAPEIHEELAQVFPHPLARAKMPRTFALDPFDVLIDPEAVCLEDARWAAHRYYISAQEADQLKKTGFYTAKDLRFVLSLPSTRLFYGLDPEGADIPDDSVYAQSAVGGKLDPESRSAFRRWEVWVFHDFQRHRLAHCITGMEDLAREWVEVPEWFRPYDAYTPNSTGDAFWSRPDAWMYLPAQKALNRVMNAHVHYADMMGKGLWFYPEGEEEFGEKLRDARAGEGIPVPPRVAALWQQIGRMSADFGKIPEALRDLKPELAAIITQMSAVSEAAQGLLVKGVTATQASLSAGSQSLRSGYNRSLLTEWASRVGETHVRLLQKLFTQEQAIPILGVEQASQWGPDEIEQTDTHLLNVSRDQIQGHFDYEVLAGDAADQVRVEQQNMALQAANLLATFIQTGVVDPQVLLPWLADKFEIPPEVIRPTPAVAPPGPPPVGVNRPPGEQGGPAGGVVPQLQRQGNGAMDKELGAVQRG